MEIRHDLHTHSTYSDGWDVAEMAAAAADFGLRSIGVTDHCPIGDDRFGRRERYDLAETYRERREDLVAAASAAGIAVHDAAEVNYDPTKEDRIAAFLDEADFAYTIGSVHFADSFDIAQPELVSASLDTRQAAVDAYVDWQVALIDSELFDVVGHLDLVQRDPVLRGLMNESHYTRIADALVGSRSTPEINAGRLDRAYGTIHPHPDRLPIFAERDIAFVLGSDAHAPDQLERRLSLLVDVLEDVPVRVEQKLPVFA